MAATQAACQFLHVAHLVDIEHPGVGRALDLRTTYHTSLHKLCTQTVQL